MKKIAVIMLAFVMVFAGVLPVFAGETQSILTIEEKLDSAEEISVPFGKMVTFTSDDKYTEGGRERYGKVYKVSLEENDIINFLFYGYDDTFIDIYTKNGETYSLLTTLDGDRMADGGEDEDYAFPQTGEYYIAVRVNYYTDYSFALNISKVGSGGTITAEELLKTAADVTSDAFEDSALIGGRDQQVTQIFGKSSSAKAYKIVLSEGERLIPSFESADGSMSGACYISYPESSIYAGYITGPYSEESPFEADVDGEYYVIALADYTENASEFIFKLNKYPPYLTLQQLLDSSNEISGEKYSETVVFDDTMALKDGWSHYYAKAYKIELKAEDTIYIDFYNSSTGYDTALDIYKADGGSYSKLDGYNGDQDNKGGYGESLSFTAAEAGVYYIAAQSRSSSKGSALLDISVNSATADPFEGLDLTQNTDLSENDFYSWDPQCKVLTLKDGFSLLDDDTENPALKVPGGTTIVVEEGASVSVASLGSDAVYCDGKLKIDMKAASSFDIRSNGYLSGSHCPGGISAVEGVEITGDSESRPNLTINSNYAGLNSNSGDIVIRNISVDLTSSSLDAVDSAGNVIIAGSDIKIDGSDGIYAGSGKVEVSNSTIDIAARYRAVETEKLILNNCITDLNSTYVFGIECGSAECEGGSLTIKSRRETIRAEEYVSLKNINIDLFTREAISLMTIQNGYDYDIDLEGIYKVYSRFGNTYIGKLSELLTYNNEYNCYIAEDGISVVRIVSVYKVEFLDDDGTVLKDTQYVEFGSAAEAPEAPVKEPDEKYNYTFSGWSADYSDVQSDLKIYAVYTKQEIKPEYADYTAVDEAIKNIPADLSVYTDESVQALNMAVNAVIRDLDISCQADVDKMAADIESAAAALVLKSTDDGKEPEDNSGNVAGDNTADDSTSGSNTAGDNTVDSSTPDNTTSTEDTRNPGSGSASGPRQDQAASANTGDVNNIWLYAVLLIAGAAGILIFRKRAKC